MQSCPALAVVLLPASFVTTYPDMATCPASPRSSSWPLQSNCLALSSRSDRTWRPDQESDEGGPRSNVEGTGQHPAG